MDAPEKESNAVKIFSSRDEIESYRQLESILKSSPIFPGEILNNLGLFLTRPSLARILFMHDLYLKIVNVPGCIMELGCHWGQNVALFSTLRTIYEPQNIGRRIIGFDTFEGYIESSEKDGQLMSKGVSANATTVSANYEVLLDRIMNCHNALGPRAHIKKHAIIKGDVTETLPAYFAEHPDTLIALIYFDLGVHEPTRKCLEAIKNHLAKGSIIGLDHLGMQELPGDSLAVMDVLGYRNFRFFRDPRVPYQSYVVVE
jgi:hypothetical protein